MTWEPPWRWIIDSRWVDVNICSESINEYHWLGDFLRDFYSSDPSGSSFSYAGYLSHFLRLRSDRIKMRPNVVAGGAEAGSFGFASLAFSPQEVKRWTSFSYCLEAIGTRALYSPLTWDHFMTLAACQICRHYPNESPWSTGWPRYRSYLGFSSCFEWLRSLCSCWKSPITYSCSIWLSSTTSSVTHVVLVAKVNRSKQTPSFS